MKHATTCAIVVIAMLLSGCAAQTFDVAEYGGESRLSQSDRLNVYLTLEDAGRVDARYDHSFGEDRQVKHTLLTGPIWRQVFVGQEDAPATITIKKHIVARLCRIQCPA